MFEQGDLKLVILRLLEEKPRHGYDIIKEIEERFGGTYAPSPGTVYPTLTMLEDMGYAKGTVEEGGKKIYAITEEGRKHLAENSQAVDSIFERMARFVEGFFDAPMNDVHEGMRRVARAAYSTATRNVRDAQKLRRVREVLDRATREIEDLARNAGTAGSAGSAGGTGSAPAGEGTGSATPPRP
ncbi:MAG: PadR family transcriptional regulator [Gemmatimonadaceae bacterium]